MSMTDQTERRETFLNDLSLKNKPGEASTFRTFAESDANQAKGRFSAELATTVIGTTPIPKYPELPSGPWSGQDPVPDENPLGYSVDALSRPEQPVIPAPVLGDGAPASAVAAPSSLSSRPQRFQARPLAGSTSSNFPDVGAGGSKLHRRF